MAVADAMAERRWYLGASSRRLPSLTWCSPRPRAGVERLLRDLREVDDAVGESGPDAEAASFRIRDVSATGR